MASTADIAIQRAAYEDEMERRYDVMPSWWWNRAQRAAAFEAWRATSSAVLSDPASTDSQRALASRFLAQHGARVEAERLSRAALDDASLEADRQFLERF